MCERVLWATHDIARLTRRSMTTQAPTAHPLRAAAEAILGDVVEVRRRLHRPSRDRAAAAMDAGRGRRGAPGASAWSRGWARPPAPWSRSSTVPGPGPTILLRADMDGLPLREDTGLDFASEVPGAMHACGHDTHVAMLLGAARLLAERRDALAGRVLLMFQPGEEGYHGAREMIEEGLLEEATARRRRRRARRGDPHQHQVPGGHDQPAARGVARVGRHDPGDRPRPRRARLRPAPRPRPDPRGRASWCSRCRWP